MIDKLFDVSVFLGVIFTLMWLVQLAVDYFHSQSVEGKREQRFGITYTRPKYPFRGMVILWVVAYICH